MRRTVSRDEVEALITRGLEAGGAVRRTSLSWSWDISGGCLAPVGVELEGRPPQWRSKAPGRATTTRLYLDMEVPCRKCETCRRRRANTWAAKAHAEMEQAYRTWFLTLTLNETTRMHTRARAQLLAAGDGISYEALSETDQFRLWVKAAYPLFQKYMKRLRKEAGPVRYLFVAEAHKDGVPHFHALLHEPAPTENLKERMLRDHWRGAGHGFCEAKLADTWSAWYTTKYLTKEVNDRVRASFKYGENRLNYDLSSQPAQRGA